MQKNSLKQEDCLYQVVEMSLDGAYLQNLKDNKVYKETDILEEILRKIGNDTILKYKNGKYTIEEELTEKFFEGLIDINEYKNRE